VLGAHSQAIDLDVQGIAVECLEAAKIITTQGNRAPGPRGGSSICLPIQLFRRVKPGILCPL
jgi:hypothetical protein